MVLKEKEIKLAGHESPDFREGGRVFRFRTQKIILYQMTWA